MQTDNKRTYAKIKNEKNNCCFECYKSKHYHRDCSKKKIKQDNCSQNDNIRFKKRRSFASVLTTKQKNLIKIKNTILVKN